MALWPVGAVPGAVGREAPDVPALTPFLVSPDDRPVGAVIICPGGGYVHLAEHEGAPVARWLNGIGVSAFVLQYRVAPYRHPHPLLDAQRAIRTVRDRAGEWGIDPQKVAILGFSAGGHLAAAAGTHFDPGDPSADDPVERQGCRPDAVILCYPVVSFGAHGHKGSMVNLLGADPPQDLRAALSGEEQVTAATPPAFVWHTADDDGVQALNSIAFCAALARYRVPYELHVYGHGRHGLGLAAGDPRVGTWTDHCAAWLAEMGYGAR